MPEGKDLCLELGASSKALPNRRKQRENDREHVVVQPIAAAVQIQWLNENGVFGRDRCKGERQEEAPAWKAEATWSLRSMERFFSWWDCMRRRMSSRMRTAVTM